MEGKKMKLGILGMISMWAMVISGVFLAILIAKSVF